ncbi:MAG: UDP-N-acetylmuramate--L-alanine ligase [Candidatus Pacebacteria bacterium]|nr:UDP-N-acetylmuramate--L-alanine ligase [Candidatus Paceibacterota bacterium]
MNKSKVLEKVNEIHFTGIKGVGMTALACCAQDLGMRITGSDVNEIFVTNEVLKRRRIRWQSGFSPENIKKPDLLIATGAHGGLANPEVKTALKKGIRAVTHAEGLAMFAGDQETISVCGVGGKTTTSAMIATVLNNLGLNPSYAIGVAGINPLGDPGKKGKGKYFVAEADEYAVDPGRDNRPRFCFQKPKVVVVTNIEHDHPDIYQNLTQTKKTFRRFFKKIPPDGLLVACIDNKNIANLLSSAKIKAPIQTYGFSPQADWRITRLAFAPGKSFFNLSYRGIEFREIVLSVPGRFNVLNATAAFAVACFCGGSSRLIIKGLAEFGGTRRRFEMIGESGGVKLYDDYAHHPIEIEATLAAAREWFQDKKLVVIFQPHTFTRTQVLMEGFARSFSQADEVIVTDIYASAREKSISGVTSGNLARNISRYKKRTFYCSTKEAACSHLRKNLSGGEIVFTLGAGDIFLWHQDLLKLFKKL